MNLISIRSFQMFTQTGSEGAHKFVLNEFELEKKK